MTHFALSELLIVVVGLWAARRLYGAQRSAAALALVLFSAAAALGVIRFGFDRDGTLIAAMADMHRFAGTMGGTAAMMALVYDMLHRRAQSTAWQGRYMLACAAALALALAFPKLSVPLFVWWSVGFIVLVALTADQLGRPAGMAMAMAGLMLFNVVVFRQASWLSVAMAWHIFHILVAVWAFGLAHLLAAPHTPQANKAA